MCRGFDYKKKFPVKKSSHPIGVDYDTNLKMLDDKDGLRFSLRWEEGMPKGTHYFYQDELEISSKEQAYIDAYEKREDEFDRKYAGWIKEALFDVSRKGIKSNGSNEPYIAYPKYLTGDALPEGLYSPKSVYSYGFILDYLKAEGKKESFREYIIDVLGRGKAEVYDLSGFVESEIELQVKGRLEAIYSEYVITYYYFKSYDSLIEKEKTTEELADYFSNVAFRAASEGAYRFLDNLLSPGQACLIANYVADRLYGLILTLNDKERLREISKEYETDIKNQCIYHLIDPKKKIEFWSEKITREEISDYYKNISEKVHSGKLRCIND